VERDSFGDTARDEIPPAKRLELNRTGEPFLQCGDDGALREWPAARQQHNETADDNKNGRSSNLDPAVKHVMLQLSSWRIHCWNPFSQQFMS
jgi:hypothetical protein